MGFALLNTAELAEDGLTGAIKEEFGPDTAIEVSRDKLFSVIVSREEAQFICTLMPFAVPDHEVEKLFPFHSLSPEAELEMGRHQAFLIIAGNGFELEKKREACLAFNRLCGAVMRLEQAVGMYMGGAGLLLEKETYLRHVEIIKSPVGEDRNYFPAPLRLNIINQRIIKDLIDEIACLSPTDLELVGHEVISLQENQRLIHHGINKDYKPSGYTVDSFSNDSLIVVEYSTDKDYFTDISPKLTDCYKKIQNDIKHAIGHKPPKGPGSSKSIHSR